MRKIQIYDTTLRDGSQAEGISFSLQDKLLFSQRLNSLGFDFIEGGFPASNEKDAQFFREIADNPLSSSLLCAFGMTQRKGKTAAEDEGVRSLINSQAPVITIVGKSSSFQATDVLKVSKDENLAMIADTVDYCCKQNRKVIFDAEHFFDGWKLDKEYALAALQTAVNSGAMAVVCCDTNGGSMPSEIASGIEDVLKAVDIPVGIHAHNDCGLAIANSLIAVEAGASQIQGTINGFGERCGNADLVAIAANLALKMNGKYNVLRPESIIRLTELARFVYEMLNVHVSQHQPFVGKSAFAHKGGMHVSGVNRTSNAYEHISPEQVGNERRVLISELSGRSNIVAKTTKYNVQHDEKLMQRILAEVVAKETAGYQYEAAEGSFDLLVRRCAGTYRPHFEKLNYHVLVDSNAEGVLVTEATVKIRIGNVVRHEVAEGDGPVDALDAAIRKALHPVFPVLREMKLTDYKVRVINSEAGTAAGVRVFVETKDSDEIWGTVGVDENVIEASWIALADSIEYKLCKHEERVLRRAED